MITTRIEDRLRDLGIELPVPSASKGAYANVTTAYGLAYVAGHGPLVDGLPAAVGSAPDKVSTDEAREAARLTMMNCLASLEQHIGSLDRVRSIVKVLGMVNSTPEFAEHPSVLDGASELLLEIFQERGNHSRSAVGMSSLPFGIPVEIEMIVEIDR